MPRPQAVPVTRRTLVRAARTPGLVEQRRVRRRDLGLRPADRRERVDARDRVEQPRRRHPLVDLAQDPRALHFLAKLGLARHVQRDGARDPDDRRARGCAEHQPAERVEHAQRRHRRRGSVGSCPPDRRGALEEDAEHDRPAERDERRVRRLAAREELRRELGAEVRAGRDPRRARTRRRRARAAARSAPRARSRPRRSSRPWSQQLLVEDVVVDAPVTLPDLVRPSPV